MRLGSICAFVVAYFASIGVTGDESQAPVVETKYGPVKGVKVDKGHFEFRKIPFAKPPLRELRFEPPEEPTPWAPSILQADGDFPEYCIQYNVFWNTTEGVEDCLYVNVFSPSLDSSSVLPVMVYIHSGGFMFGRGSHFRGDLLMETKAVVTVIFQYRLGSFGFLNTEDSQSYGNMGMKDQLLALKFVQENIRGFGGDPDRVMIFGTSAGAASVHYHLLSPLSTGYFHSAFSGSGTALCPWAWQPSPSANAERLGTLLGCDDYSNLVSCLREKTADEIGMAHRQFLDWNSDPITAFGPSLEIGNPDKATWFLPKHPADIMEDGKGVNKVPWILGFDSDEGWEHTLSIYKTKGLLQQLNAEFEKLAPITLEYVHESDGKKKEITGKVREFYFHGKTVIGEDETKNLSNAYSDKTYILGTVVSASRHAELGQPVYLFKFEYPGDHSIVTLRGFPREGFGCNHMDDIQYLINCPLFGKLSDKDKSFQQKYIRMITTFAASKELPAFSDESDKWEPIDKSGSVKLFHITENPKMEPMSPEMEARLKFWIDLTPQEIQPREAKAIRDEL